LHLLAQPAELDLARPQRGVVRLGQVARDLVVGQAGADRGRLEHPPGEGGVRPAARGVHHLDRAGAAAVEDHPRLEGFDGAALGVLEQARGGAGQRFIALLGDDGGEAGLDLGLHQQRRLVVAEVAQPGQHGCQPRDVAQLAGPALAVDVQHVARGDRLAGQSPARHQPRCAGVDAVQPVGERLAGLAEGDAL
jgi:hypothetical protein